MAFDCTTSSAAKAARWFCCTVMPRPAICGFRSCRCSLSGTQSLFPTYAQPGGMRAGFEYFRNFERDAKDFAELSAWPLSMPVLVLTGEKASGNFLIEQTRLVATNVQGQIVIGSGHWLMEEAPDKVIPA